MAKEQHCKIDRSRLWQSYHKALMRNHSYRHQSCKFVEVLAKAFMGSEMVSCSVLSCVL